MAGVWLQASITSTLFVTAQLIDTLLIYSYRYM